MLIDRCTDQIRNRFLIQINHCFNSQEESWLAIKMLPSDPKSPLYFNFDCSVTHLFTLVQPSIKELIKIELSVFDWHQNLIERIWFEIKIEFKRIWFGIVYWLFHDFHYFKQPCWIGTKWNQMLTITKSKNTCNYDDHLVARLSQGVMLQVINYIIES